MIRNVTVNELFPTPLWIVDLEPDQAAALNDHLFEQIDRLTAPREDHGPGTTWQTDQNLHTLPEFATLTELIMKAAHGALAFLEIEPGDLQITGCWANVNPTGAQHRTHHHPNNFLSGVYYVRSSGVGGEIEFSDPRPGAEILMPPVKADTRFNRNVVASQPIEGRLILFPSYLKHSVNVNRSPSDRISIAFNIMFADFAERMAMPLWRATKERGIKAE